MNMQQYTNHLNRESSPYLLQHAHNPVNWYPWCHEALDRAAKENKLIIVSIGYAACHWCHVMEHECFEDTVVADFMNDHFIAIKVDREERPDLDMVYMNAVQLITGGGGWPLNVIALPDGRPLYGGTYFPKQQWLSVLKQVSDFVKNNPDKAEQHAKALTDGVQRSGIVNENPGKVGFNADDLHEIFYNWKPHIDFSNGGSRGAPKFPMPVGFQFLLHYHFLTKDPEAIRAVTITLDKMADGGIHDQIGGGFARYSTDILWKVPHFEKMLYDNAQLVSLYSSAFQVTKDPRYRSIVYETLGFIERELASKEGGFYSSLDADSDGEEGRYYTWYLEEFEKLLGTDALLIADFFHMTSGGNWENGKNVLYAAGPDQGLLAKYCLKPAELNKKVAASKDILFRERLKRNRPSLDDKMLTAWNALMIKGYADAYRVFDDQKFLDAALKTAEFIRKNLQKPDYRLDRNFKNGKSTINGFLEDYALTIDAYIALYQSTFNEKWLGEAQNLMVYVLAHFYDTESGMFFFTSDTDPALIARKTEIADHVIPSANSVMAKNLYILGRYFLNGDYLSLSKRMLNNVQQDAIEGNVYYANWDVLWAWVLHEPYEVVIAGDDCAGLRKEFDTHYLPNLILAGGNSEGSLPLLKDRFIEGQTTIYVCRYKTCKRPVTTVQEAISQIMG